MCTVTFVPRRTGYILGMNRDELLTRPTGLPPAIHERAGRAYVCPAEPTGGTWISLNDAGVCLALINWYSVTARVTGESVSRGEVVRQGALANSSREVELMAAGLPLARMKPFRLLGVFPREREVVEWRWNGLKLVKYAHPWKAGIWISSGFDEPGAQQTRGTVFASAREQAGFGTSGWLQRLHSSHAPARGPYSVCQHRADAATVSYTEVRALPGRLLMRHLNDCPCRAASTPATVTILPARLTPRSRRDDPPAIPLPRAVA